MRFLLIIISLGGGYIVFLDADDYLDKDALCRLNDIITSHKHLDIILCNSIYHRHNDKALKRDYIFVPQELENRVFAPKKLLSFLPELHLYAVYNGAFCCDFLRRESLYFEASIIFEDVLFMQIALCIAKRVFIANEAIYYYRIDRPDSIMTSKSRKRELKATFSHFVLAKIFLEHFLKAKDDVFSAYLRHWAIFFAKETLRHIQFLGYIDEIGFTKYDLKPFVRLLPLKYRFCYHCPRVYGFPKRVRLFLEQFVATRK